LIDKATKPIRVYKPIVKDDKTKITITSNIEQDLRVSAAMAGDKGIYNKQRPQLNKWYKGNTSSVNQFKNF
jgi:hypothetical protein